MNPICQNYTVKDIPLSLLDELTPMDIEEYLSYLKYYEKNGVEHTNDERGIKRKLASLRSFYRYYFKNDLIKNDPAVKVDMPKIHDKNIIRLDIDEVARLLDEVESGESLTPRQQKYHDRTKTRDLALMTLLLGTGTVSRNVSDSIWKTWICAITASRFTEKAAQRLLYTLGKKYAKHFSLIWLSARK